MFLDSQLWNYSDSNMILENKMNTWMYGNKTWRMPKEDGEGYIAEFENNLSVLGLFYGKSKVIYTKYSKQFKWNSYFYVSGQNRPFWAALKLL